MTRVVLMTMRMTTELKQRSWEWRKRRLGDITASNFALLMGRGKGKSGWTVAATAYQRSRIVEMLTGRPTDTFASDAMKHGIAEEPYAFDAARSELQYTLGVELHQPVGEMAYVQHPTEQYIGASPDGWCMIGDELWTLEIKCPANPCVHLDTVLDGVPSKHQPQMQGAIWITGAAGCIYASYSRYFEGTRVPSLMLSRVASDQTYIEFLSHRVLKFRDDTLAKYREFVDVGPF